MCEQARKLCLLGATNEDLAAFFNVATSTVDKWISESIAFSGAIKEAKEELDSKVVRRLFERATGYSHPDVHISNYQGDITQTPITKHYAPDTTASIFWLKNRQPEKWRDRIEHTGANGGAIKTEEISDVKSIARRVAFLLAAGAQA